MRNVHVRVAVPLAILLAANVGASAWVTWSQLSDDVASSLESYAGGLDRIPAGLEPGRAFRKGLLRSARFGPAERPLALAQRLRRPR